MNIVVLIFYYGKFPWYIDYFLHSCKFNSSIDFLIVTDNETVHKNLPRNVRFKKKSIAQIMERAIKKLGFAICINDSYKLCDFKPAYGFLFPELISGYDFWGHGDIDVIFGQIRNFITEEVLLNHDFISVRHDFLTGYFQLLKNNDKLNTLFMYSKDYKKVFTSAEHLCFDETNFAFEQFTNGVPLNEIQSEIESMTHVVKRLHDKKIINAYFDFHVIEGLPGRLKWHNGMLTYKNEFEVMLYHMILFKKVYNPKNSPKQIPDTFYISPTRIYS